ncbi:putative P2Y purinoceptor 10 [Spea bombifrons]|uniref:putative P2Y purinoceptor 10 n=1 Tax=Spea bombifrons TaxID=233779 RepID=UPI00234A7642|nr:putative P2Y purinoceptor 10 [Spea bombifrons]
MATLQNCSHVSDFQYTLYSSTYIIIFIPGLLANSVACWVLCSLTSKKNKAIIFMINLSLADLAHVLSLPLRIYYYTNHTWPFKNFLCLMCFYLKYLNMYASIIFLMLISVQRYVFTTNPFRAKDWKRRYDITISFVVWIVVGLSCLPFPLLRSSGLNNTSTACFADLGMKTLSVVPALCMLTVAELAGFIIPVTVIAFCTLKTRAQLTNKILHFQNMNEKRKALRLVVTCAALFFVCFAPYHINFFFYMLINLNVIKNCTVHKVILTFHPFSICLASFNCCLDPILYYFTASEFKNEVVRHGSTVIRGRLMSRESRESSFKE